MGCSCHLSGANPNAFAIIWMSGKLGAAMPKKNTVYISITYHIMSGSGFLEPSSIWKAGKSIEGEMVKPDLPPPSKEES